MRIVTRGDIDGLTAYVLLSEMEDIGDIVFTYPQDITDKKFEVLKDDIIVNLPYDPVCKLWFDHHKHTVMPSESNDFKGRHALKDSSSRVVFDHYHSPALEKYRGLVEETSRFGSAKLTIKDVEDPQGIVLLAFLIDPRTGMSSEFEGFFKHMAERLKIKTPNELLKDTDLSMRASRYKRNIDMCKKFLLKNSEINGNVVITDLRKSGKPPVGNRFLIFTTHPEANVSVRIQWGPDKSFVVVNLSHSIFNKSCKVDVGLLCREHGGGGHKGAGACSLDPSMADIKILQIIDKLKS